ncbi:RING finger protein nenya-like [Drosophila busckii]|uniref:RING finger protein nenya-like n=1 Tax=Drosophila busckii TaxID=30019 RepID=UPI00083F2B82|nr:RING finger protein nenya-like [Drosophila busckii]
MFQPRCNKCIKDADAGLLLSITRCQHILCSQCIKTSNDKNRCPICMAELKSVPINRNMPHNISHYFDNPSKYLKLYRDISRFQMEQRAYTYNHYATQELHAKERKSELRGYLRLDEQICKKIEIEKKRIKELRNYIDSSKISFAKGNVCRPRTPTFSTTDTSSSPTECESNLGESFTMEHLAKLFNKDRR